MLYKQHITKIVRYVLCTITIIIGGSIYNRYYNNHYKIFVEYFKKHNYKIYPKNNGFLIFTTKQSLSNIINTNIRIKSIQKQNKYYIIFAQPEGTVPRKITLNNIYCSHIKI